MLSVDEGKYMNEEARVVMITRTREKMRGMNERNRGGGDGDAEDSNSDEVS